MAFRTGFRMRSVKLKRMIEILFTFYCIVLTANQVSLVRSCAMARTFSHEDRRPCSPCRLERELCEPN